MCGGIPIISFLSSLTGAMSSLYSLTCALFSLSNLTGAMSSLCSLTGALSSLSNLTGALSSLSNLTGAMSSLSSLTVCPSYYSSSSPHHSPQGVPSVPSSLHQGVKNKLKTITDSLPPDLQMRLCGVVAWHLLPRPSALILFLRPLLVMSVWGWGREEAERNVVSVYRCLHLCVVIYVYGGEYSVVVCSVICLESVMFKRRSTHACICMHLLPSTQHLLLSGLAWSMVHFNFYLNIIRVWQQDLQPLSSS